MTVYAAAPAREVPLWRDVVVLLKPRIDALVVLVAVAAAAAAGETSLARIGALAAATFGASAGASALNHYLERDTDARMPRTSTRPLPSGRVAPATALTLGLVLVALSQLVVFPLGAEVAAYLLAGAITYAVVYTWWLKPRTPWATVWGGAAGSFAALAGWQVHASTLRPAPQLLAVVLFLWTPSHFWSFAIARQDEYRSAGFPMLTTVVGGRRAAQVVWLNTLALVAAAVALGVYVGLVYLAFAVAAGVWFAHRALVLRRDPSPVEGWILFKLSGIYLLALLVGLLLQPLV